MPSIISVTYVHDNYFDNKKIQQLRNSDITRIVLFDKPIQLGFVQITKDHGDKNNYIIKLYKTYF